MRRVYVVALNTLPFLPYIHGLLRAMVDTDPEVAADFRFEQPYFFMDPAEGIAEGIVEPDVVGFSCYVWNFRRTMKVARLVKERWPDALLVAGGPHVPERIGTFFDEHPYIDLAVHGEGEMPFLRILQQRRSASPDYTQVRGVSLVSGGRAVTTGPGEKLPKTIELPSAYASGYLDEAIRYCRQREPRFVAPWETNRGCPYSCTFCDWGSATMTKLRSFTSDRIAQEIEYFARERVPMVFICDANFGILPRDEEIIDRFVEAKALHGFPQQIRTNFAKNSNNRVFDISRKLFEKSMLMGTTLSLQSTNPEVLRAVERENIAIVDYRAWLARYREAGIPAYTELILALPRETRASFVEGVARILESGIHDDLRVFECCLLPNAPMNSPESLHEHQLETFAKDIYLESPDVPDIDRERVEVVVSTSTMSREEWVTCRVYAELVQALHNGALTRFLTIWLRDRRGVSYERFYAGIQAWALERPSTVLGGILLDLTDMYRRYQTDPHIPQLQAIASQPDMARTLAPFGLRYSWRPDQWAWLRIIPQLDEFYAELVEFVADLTGEAPDAEFLDCLRYQQDAILRPEYDPGEGKRCAYGFDWPGYFTGRPLVRRRTSIHYRDSRMGFDERYPLVRNHLAAFASAAVGESYPFLRIRHFFPQIDRAEVVYDDAVHPVLA